jgi:hypothetical protein
LSYSWLNKPFWFISFGYFTALLFYSIQGKFLTICIEPTLLPLVLFLSIDRVFTLYQRFHTNSKKGFGLYLAASKVQSQGGSISIEKSDESGTIILISFKLQNMFNNVMLVEDDDVTMMLCKINLKKTNFTPNLICCGNGYEAFNFLETEIEKPEIERIIPDLIFLDINMPVMNG